MLRQKEARRYISVETGPNTGGTLYPNMVENKSIMLGKTSDKRP